MINEVCNDCKYRRVFRYEYPCSRCKYCDDDCEDDFYEKDSNNGEEKMNNEITPHLPDSEECCDTCKYLMKRYYEYPCCECSYTNKSSEKSYYEPEEGENMIDCETCKNAVPESTYNHDSTKCKRCIGGDENGYELKNSREYILDKAKECVCGHREEDYGVPEQNFQLIADLWNDYLGFNCDENSITCKDVAIMMALLKIARIKRGGGSGDSYVDLAGYAACAGELAARTGL